MPVVTGWWLLAFLIYRPADGRVAEEGHVIARSCAIAEAYIRAGLREGQAVSFGACEQQPATVAGP